MPIRFAAPRHAIRNRMDDAGARASCQIPANDNTAKHTSEAMLHEALKQFAEHGLAAGRHASTQARIARAKGDEQGFRWWLEVCRALDRRLASKLDRQATGS